ncbi:MAG: UDP-N-acetylmuramate--L-alanine ligase [Desulfobacteraceae bacterium]|nr:UDP-N-acetylmuramate--L-alanine ligase [Desulfobacteraceae bacterium]MCB9494506.1 UDP-N-acetylmuramate--L-alanine ligase [Desulfobacteraceae bacterium]
MFDKSYHIHLVGIGGIGMSSIAEILLAQGYNVSGSDLNENSNTKRLKELGGTVFNGHNGLNSKDADVVVVSSAVPDSNPEIIYARENSIPVIPRAEMLAELMRLKYGVAVAGAHGKTTTTSLVSEILIEGNIDPTIIIGGKLKRLGTNARLGLGSFLVAEADESDGSFLKMTPSISIVTNIDREHLDYYQSIEDIKKDFLEFINKIPFYGLSIICLDNEYIQDILPEIKKRYITYGLQKQADYRAKNLVFYGLKSHFDVEFRGELKGRINLNLPGEHNVSNALAAIALGCELEIPFETIQDALEKISGVQRRIEIKGEYKNLIVIDDYGHHPTEIQTTLKTIRKAYPDKIITVVFQPHRFSRTKALFEDFTRSFYESDRLVIIPVYPAGEKEIKGIDNFSLCEGIKKHGHKDVNAFSTEKEVLDFLSDIKNENAIILTLGAGNINKLGEKYITEYLNA